MWNNSKKVLKTVYTVLQTHRRKKHTNRSYGERETITEKITL
jgi:hypothetical protein